MLFSKKWDSNLYAVSEYSRSLQWIPYKRRSDVTGKRVFRYMDAPSHGMLERIESKQKPPKMPEYAVLENGDKLLDNFDLCRMLHVSKRTLQRYRTECGLPYQLLNQKTYYRESEVLHFIETNLDKLHNLRNKENGL